MRIHSWHAMVPVGLLLLPLLAFTQEPPPPKEQPKQDTPKPRLDLYGDPLPEGAVARLGLARFAHGSDVRSLAFSHDGLLVAVGCQDRIVLRDVGTGGIRLFLKDFFGRIQALAFSPDGERLLSGGGSGLRIWDVTSGKLALTLSDRNRGIRSVAFAPDGRLAATGGHMGMLRLWDSTTGELLRDFPGLNDVEAVAFSPDGEMLVGVRHHDFVRLRNVSSGEEVRRLGSEQAVVTKMAFSSDGKLIAWGEEGGTVRLSHLDLGTDAKVLALLNHDVVALSFSPDTKRLIALSTDGVIRTWEVASGKEVSRAKIPGEKVSVATFSPRADKVAWACRSFVRIESVAALKDGQVPPGHSDRVNSVAFSRDAKTVATASEDGTIILWNSASGTHMRTIRVVEYGVSHVSFSPDGKLLACTVLDDPTIGFWHARSAEAAFKLLAGEEEIEQVAFSPNGELLASVGVKGRVRLWNLSNREIVHTISIEDMGAIVRVCFSPSGELLATVSAFLRPVDLWKVSTGEHIGTMDWPGDLGNLIKFTRDGRFLCVSGSDRVQILEVATGRPWISRKVDTSRYEIMAISPNGRQVAVAGAEGSIEIRSLPAWDVLATRRGHRGRVGAFSFSSDGARLLSGSADSTALVWDLPPTPPESSSPPLRLERPQLEQCWKELAGADASAARKAIDRLVRGERDSLPFLRKSLRPSPYRFPERVRQLIDLFESEDFSRRETASEDLRKLGSGVTNLLREALANAKSPEARQRLTALLKSFEPPVFLPPGDLLRMLRSTMILERMGTPDAVGVLRMLETEASFSRVRGEALAALQRLERRGSR